MVGLKAKALRAKFEDALASFRYEPGGLPSGVRLLRSTPMKIVGTPGRVPTLRQAKLAQILNSPQSFRMKLSQMLPYHCTIN